MMFVCTQDHLENLPDGNNNSGTRLAFSSPPKKIFFSSEFVFLTRWSWEFSRKLWVSEQSPCLCYPCFPKQICKKSFTNYNGYGQAPGFDKTGGFKEVKGSCLCAVYCREVERTVFVGENYNNYLQSQTVKRGYCMIFKCCCFVLL